MDLKYKIVDDKGKVLAAFRNSSDRNDFIEELRERFDDCEFTEVEN